MPGAARSDRPGGGGAGGSANWLRSSAFFVMQEYCSDKSGSRGWRQLVHHRPGHAGLRRRVNRNCTATQPKTAHDPVLVECLRYNQMACLLKYRCPTPAQRGRRTSEPAHEPPQPGPKPAHTSPPPGRDSERAPRKGQAIVR